MRFSVLPIAIIIFVSTVLGEDIETLNHDVYKNTTITRVEPDGVVITHSAGIVKIPFSELPPEYAQRFSYDKSKGEKFTSEQAEAQRQLYLKTQHERQIANARDAEISANSAAEADRSLKRKAIASFVLNAKEIGTGDASSDTWKTDYGSYDRQTTQNKRIAIQVHDLGGSTADCSVDVYFVGKSLTQNVHFIYAHQSVQVRVGPQFEGKTEVLAPALDSRVLNLAALGEQYAAGAVMEGWIVTGQIEGQRFGLVASNGLVTSNANGLISDFQTREKERRQ